jgi:hypothetical protein
MSATLVSDGDAQICRGSSVKLMANSGTDFKYEWYWNNQLIPNAKSATYTASVVGNYTVKVSQGTCSVNSQTLAVSESPLRASVVSEGNTNLCSGGSLKLTANTGTGLKYQWLRNGVAITGATTNTFVARETGTYNVNIRQANCLVSSSGIIATSSGTLLNANTSPNTETTRCDGLPVKIQAATGTNYRYQWFKDGQTIANATRSSFDATQNGTYWVRIANTQCFTNSAEVKVNFSNLKISITPTGVVLLSPGKALTINASSGTGYKYQWFRNTEVIAGATAQSYTTNRDGIYLVRASNGNCATASLPVWVQILTSNKSNAIETESQPLILYPNPASDQITAAYLPDSTDDESILTYEVYNAIGLKMAEGELEKTDSQHFQKEIPIQNLPSGVYFVVINNRRRLVTGKFQKD